MNVALFASLALHGALFITCACVLWLCLRGQSAARTAAGGRIIMAATLLLAAGEAGLALWQSRGAGDFLRNDIVEPPLPQHAGAAGDALLAVVPAAPAATEKPPASAVAAPPAAVVPRWELSPETEAILFYLWLSGAALVLARWFLALAARKRLMRAAQEMAVPHWQAMLLQMPGGCGVKLLRHPGDIVPCAWGRTILLPARAGDWPPEQRRMVLAHECAHIHQRDPFWLALAQCFLALQWFQPLAWYAVRRCRLASERAADDAVLNDSPDALAYAELLVTCARGRIGPQSVLCGMASRSSVAQRVERILDEKADRRPAGTYWPVACAAAVGGIIAVVLMLAPQMSVAQIAPPQTPAETTTGDLAPAPVAPSQSAPPATPAAPGEGEKAGGKFAWNPTKIQDREYLSVEQIQQFYKFRSEPGDDGLLKLRSPRLALTLQRNSPDIFINGVKFVLKYPVLEHETRLWLSRADLSWVLEPVIRPGRIANQQPITTVVIDPGHGGEDIGAQGLRGMESLYTLDTARMLKTKLEAAGWTVILTRTKEDFVPRPERVVIANQHPDALFVSIHFNSTPAAEHGFETYVPGSPRADDTGQIDEAAAALQPRSVALATAVHANCIRRLEMKDRGVKGARFDVLAGIHIPGILVEGGFISNIEDAARIADANHRDKFAAAIAQGIENYRRALGQKPNVRDPAREPPK